MMEYGFNVHFLDEYVILECTDCGELEVYSYEDFQEMIDNGEIDIFEVLDEDMDEDDMLFEGECGDCFCDCEDEYVDDELDYLLDSIAEEIDFALAMEDYEGVATLSVAYANLFELI